MSEDLQPIQEPLTTPVSGDMPHSPPTDEHLPDTEEEAGEETTRPNQQDCLQNEIRAGWRRALGR